MSHLRLIVSTLLFGVAFAAHAANDENSADVEITLEWPKGLDPRPVTVYLVRTTDGIATPPQLVRNAKTTFLDVPAGTYSARTTEAAVSSAEVDADTLVEVKKENYGKVLHASVPLRALDVRETTITITGKSDEALSGQLKFGRHPEMPSVYAHDGKPLRLRLDGSKKYWFTYEPLGAKWKTAELTNVDPTRLDKTGLQIHVQDIPPQVEIVWNTTVPGTPLPETAKVVPILRKLEGKDAALLPTSVLRPARNNADPAGKNGMLSRSRLEDIKDGEYLLDLVGTSKLPPAALVAATQPQRIRIEKGVATPSEIRYTLSADRIGTLQLTVRDVKGKEVEGVFTALRRTDGLAIVGERTSSKGVVDFGRLLTGDYVAEAQIPDMPPLTRNITVHPRTNEITLSYEQLKKQKISVRHPDAKGTFAEGFAYPKHRLARGSRIEVRNGEGEVNVFESDYPLLVCVTDGQTVASANLENFDPKAAVLNLPAGEDYPVKVTIPLERSKDFVAVWLCHPDTSLPAAILKVKADPSDSLDGVITVAPGKYDVVALVRTNLEILRVPIQRIQTGEDTALNITITAEQLRQSEQKSPVTGQ